MYGRRQTNGPQDTGWSIGTENRMIKKKEFIRPLWNIYRNPVNESGTDPQFFHHDHQAFSVLIRVFHSFNTLYYDNDFDNIYNHSIWF